MNVNPKAADDDFEREIHAHLDLEADQLADEGLAGDDARRAAVRRFGNVTAVRERFYEARRIRWVDEVRQDLRSALRHLRRYPIAALVAVLSLAAGIGAATVTLTIRSAVFHRPPSTYRQPEALSRLHLGRPDRSAIRFGGPVAADLYRAWRDVLGDSIAAGTVSRGEREIRTADRVEVVSLRAVSPNLFPLLGVEPAAGRGFGPTADDATGPAPAVLSYGLWQRLFDRRADAIGQVISIDGRAHAVIGVMPAPFWFGDMNSPIWTRLGDEPAAATEPLDVVVRRAPAETPAMLEARLQRVLAEYATRAKVQWRLATSGMGGTPLGHQVAQVLPYVLGTAVLLTLLIACANVAGLMIAQWTAREHEIAIRTSIGATRARIVRALLTESVVLAASGGVLGVGTTLWLREWVVRRGDQMTFFDVSIDTAILFQVAAIVLLTGLIVGIVPALAETRRLHASPLRALAGAGADRFRQRWRNALVIVEVAITVALLVETTTMVDGYQRARRAVMGFDARPLVAARVEDVQGLSPREVIAAAERVAGVASVAAATAIPFQARGSADRVAADPSGSRATVTERSAVSAGFFKTLGVPVTAGRGFAATADAATGAAVVNETLARRLFDDRTPVGARVWFDGTPYDVVGVVADYSSNPLRPAGTEPRLFLPLSAAPTNRVQLLLRAHADPQTIIGPLRGEIRKMSAGATITQAFPLAAVLDLSSREILAGTAPLAPLVAMATLLTVSGIYGVLAFALARRGRELAVRVAVGAGAADVVRVIAGHAARLVAIGAGIGVAVTFGLARVVRANGGAGSVFDPPVHAFVLPVVTLAVLAAVASWIPARRALKIDPLILLRTN